MKPHSKPNVIGKISLTTSNTNPSSTSPNTPNSNPTTSPNTNPPHSITHKRAKSTFKSKHAKSKHHITNIITQIPTSSQSSLPSSPPTSKPQHPTLNFNQTLSLFKQSRSMSPHNKRNKYLLPEKTSNKKTLVLDLDETLVHSGFIPFNTPSDLIIQIEFENETHDIHVLVRPFVKEFLEKMAEKYELVVFTASLSKYANPLLNIIDKQGYCPFRLYREHCTLINTAFVKDLTRLGRDLKDIIILDNSPVAYALNVDNGFPIPSWFNDKNDYELIKIIPILEFLSYVPDVRVYIRKLVKNNQVQFHLVSGIINSYNNMLKNHSMPLSLRYSSGFEALASPKMNKSNSIKGNNMIKKIYIESVGSGNTGGYVRKKHTKMLNITGVEVTNANGKKRKSGQQYLNKLTFGSENVNRMNTMRSNSSTKKIVYVVGKEKKGNGNGIINNALRTKLKNFLSNTAKNVNVGNGNGCCNGNGVRYTHKKNTLSMSQRMNKNNVL